MRRAALEFTNRIKGVIKNGCRFCRIIPQGNVDYVDTLRELK